MTLGERIKAERKRSGLTQEELSDKLCVSRQAIQKWESDNGVPSIENLKAISQLFHVTIDSLVSNDEVPVQEETPVQEEQSVQEEEPIHEDAPQEEEPQEATPRQKIEYCPQCGAEHFVGLQVCDRCGYCLIPDDEPSQTPPPEEPSPELLKKAKRKKKLKIALSLVIPISVIGIVAIGMFIPTFIAWNEEPVWLTDETGVVYVYDKKTKICSLQSIGSNTDTDFVIPSEFKGKPVTEIANHAFQNAAIESVTIEGNITAIGHYAFRNCKELKTVTIGNSVTTIGIGTFEDCGELKTVSFGNGVTTIGDDAFASCVKLKEVSLGNNVTTICRNAFYNCSKLEEITMGDSVTMIGDSAFDKCARLETVSIGSGIKEIGNLAFANCIRLNSITYNGTFMEWYAIPRDQGYWDKNTANFTVTCTDGTTGKAQEVDWLQYSCEYDEDKDSYTIKGFNLAGADNYLDPVTTITIPASYHGKPVTIIGERAFRNMTALPVIIPEGVTEIEEYAFAGSKVRRVVIPKSVTTIGKRIFEECKYLYEDDITYSGTMEEWKAINKYPYETQYNGDPRSVICSDGTVEWGAE